jgi:hypothetical protein
MLIGKGMQKFYEPISTVRSFPQQGLSLVARVAAGLFKRITRSAPPQHSSSFLLNALDHAHDPVSDCRVIKRL